MSNLSALRAAVAEVQEPVPIDFGGGCSLSKATVLAEIIKSQGIKRSIDIGIYRGRSFFPQAMAHTRYTRGKVIGIDPYSKEEAMEFDHKELEKEITHFVETTDFDDMFLTVDGLRATLGVAAGSEILRMTSDQAAEELAKRGESFGLIHIDGNHDTGAVVKDVANYLPLLDPNNGYLVLDDISWSSVKPAVDAVSAELSLLYARVDTYNDYAVFWTGDSRAKKSRLRKRIALAGEN